MKKFAYGILSVFILLGGILLGACQKQVSLSVSTNDVVLYTNETATENSDKKEIEVSVENSSFGVRVEILEGNECVQIDKEEVTQKKANGKYSFNIMTKEKQSGYAKVRVSSIEDGTKSEIINVSVMTMLEEIKALAVDDPDEQTDRFVVKNIVKQLDFNQYFEPDPITSNVIDIDWCFDDKGSKVLVKDGRTVATIDEYNFLSVNEYYADSEIVVRAVSKKDTNIFGDVTFAVIENATIDYLYASDAQHGEEIYADGQRVISQSTFNIKRNARDAAENYLEGTITVNVPPFTQRDAQNPDQNKYEIVFGIDVFDVNAGRYLVQDDKDFTKDEVHKYFTHEFEFVSRTATTETYSFVIDASAGDILEKAYGNFIIYFKATYKYYKHSIRTDDVDLRVNVEYTAERIDVQHDGVSISQADIFSSYNTERGYSIVSTVEPSDIPIDNNRYRFAIDTQQSNLRGLVGTNPIGQVASFVANGRELTFTPSALGSAVYVSEELVSSTEVFVLAKGTFENVEVVVESMSNVNANASLYIYFYEISDEQDLDVTNSDDTEVAENRYMSTSQISTRTLTYELKVHGITSLAGLELATGKYENGKIVEKDVSDIFVFSTPLLKVQYNVGDEKYIIIEFSVTAERYNFTDEVYFWFKHITGKTSAQFGVSAYVPITKASLQNFDKSSADLYIDMSKEQAFVLEDGELVSSGTFVNSVAKLMVEAGTTLSLDTNVYGATLNSEGIRYKYLPYEEIADDMAALDIHTDEDIFDVTDLITAAKLYPYFHSLPFESETLFNIDAAKLQIGDNAFKGFVCVLFGGYDENHESVTLARLFALESFYSVKYLSSNVTNKLLYTTTTLSEKDMGRSYVDVTLSLRPDDRCPTYVQAEDKFERLNFSSTVDWTSGSKETYLDNGYYMISAISFAEDGNVIRFKITANSTNLHTSFQDWLTVTYRDGNGIDRKTEIQLQIKNAKRIESVVWLNRTIDDIVYLTTSQDSNSFTISTSVLPSDASDISLMYKYVGSSSDFDITPSTIGQTINLRINTKKAGMGYIYLLPTDMVKIVDGSEKVLLYKYTENDTIEIPNYDVSLVHLDRYFNNIITGEGELDVSPYFLNNDGERVYYRDLILRIKVVVADGSNEDLALRIYGQNDLAEIKDRPALYYELANDITLIDWAALPEVRKQIDGKGHTLTFVKDSVGCEAFVDQLTGTIKNTIFVGDVEKTMSEVAAGFIANTVSYSGRIENCVIDVYNDGSNYRPSTLRATAGNVGGVAGQNGGTISATYVYGLNITATGNNAGGIVGRNSGKIVGCGIEFYKFAGDVSNEIQVLGDNSQFGGIAQFTEGTIEKSYLYDFTDGNVVTANSVYGIAGHVSDSETKLVEVFAYFAGEVSALAQKPYENYDSLNVLNNGYLSFNRGETIKYYTLSGEVSESSLTDETIWGNDGDINFGHKYLVRVLPTEALNLDNIKLDDVSVLGGQKMQAKSVDGLKGVLFAYKTTTNVVLPGEKAALDAYNTINIRDLFVNYVRVAITAFEDNVTYYVKEANKFVQVAQGEVFDPEQTYYVKEKLTDRQARVLLMTSANRSVVLSSEKLRIADTTLVEFEISVHLKMDYTESQAYTFIILNAMPSLTTTIDGEELDNGRTVLLQKTKERSVYYNAVNSVSLAGTIYALQSERFDVLYSGEDEYVGLTKAGSSIVLKGKQVSEDVDTAVSTLFTVANISLEYQRAIGIARDYNVSVYAGATGLTVVNASTLNILPSSFAKFDVLLTTDNLEDNLEFTLSNGEIEVLYERGEGNSIKFVVDSNLTLDVAWTKGARDGDVQKFGVVVKIDAEKRHLINQEYNDLLLSVNATSQKDNSLYEKNIAVKVETQPLDDISMSVYLVESRQVRNSVLYITKSNNLATTIAPATDAILAVAVDPAYAKMSHFTVTYSVTGTGEVGTISISRVMYSSMYGYYTDLSAARLIENGILVNMTDADKQVGSNGMYYFRIYASNAFTKEANVKFTATFYDGEKELLHGSHDLAVSSLSEATVKVNGASTYLLAKGDSAEVTIEVGQDQTLYNLYLENNQRDIYLSSPTYEIVDGVKIYRATLTVGIDTLLATGNSTGMFYVCATVERVINGVQEFKSSRATVCLTDFSIDVSETKVAGSTRKLSYQGKEYDAIYSYINEESELYFNYKILPEELVYDKNDTEQVRIAEQLMRNRNAFIMNNSYADNNAEYYINYQYNTIRGTYDEITLKQQLWYASSEGNVTKLYNDFYEQVIPNDYFNVDVSNGVKITGKRAGNQLMMLRTTIYYQGIEFVHDYYFLIRVEIWTDEDAPLEIASAEEFIDKATNGDTAAHYILTKDIVLNNYTPIADTHLFESFDGNGYTIHINSFAMQTESSTLRLALFDTVEENTLLKNVKVNIYNGGQITVNYTRYTDISIAGFAVTNKGIIYNCEVVAYYDENYQSARLTDETGLIVKYVQTDGGDPVAITDNSNISSTVAGFVVENESNATIVNSRVGGEELLHFIELAGITYLEHIDLDVFTLEGQGMVSGFVGANNGFVSASFAKQMQIYNKMSSVSETKNRTAGFALQNTNSIQNSYVEGLGGYRDPETDKLEPYNNLSNMSTMGIASGFVYENSGVVRNSYANIAIDNINTKSYMAAGFVYKNQAEGVIELCYAACEVLKSDVGEMQFTGVDSIGQSLNYGTVSISYYYNESKIADGNESKVSSGAIGINEIDEQGSFYGFSFASGEYNGIWRLQANGVTLVSANQIALSNRYVKQVTSVQQDVFYRDTVIDLSTYATVLIKYGSQNNPFIIKSAADFAKATGSSNISVYKEYFSDTEVFGNPETGIIVSYRLVTSLDMNEIVQSPSSPVVPGKAKLTTTQKTLSYGLIDGNSFTIANINLGSNNNAESFGLFAKIKDSVVMNLNLTVEDVHDDEANVVGVLAGEAIHTQILAISLKPAGIEQSAHSVVRGKNIVGGIVGMLLGDSRLSDITVSAMDVTSVYYKQGKEIGENAIAIAGGGAGGSGFSIRNCVDYGLPLASNVETLSYAGAIVGFVDIYNGISNAATVYSTSLSSTDYNVTTIRVNNAVNIYAEVAGGLFGYIGMSTKVYDASIELNARMNLENPSYIIAKNLYSGGLVGENYGGLHAIYARYSSELQQEIEGEKINDEYVTNQWRYNNGDTSLERGQSSIFSYTSSEAGYEERTNKPKYIGGLVGYMGGGFMYVAYNKLNVVSHTDETQAVGGIIGLLARSSVYYSLTFMNNPKAVNMLLHDVYASGDVYGGENTYAAGIIGAMPSGGQSILALKDVLAVNYYSNEALENMDKHAMLIGGENALETDLYLLDNYNELILDPYTATYFPGNSLTVGGFNVTKNGRQMKVFGFQDSLPDAIIEIQYVPIQYISDFDPDKTYYKREGDIYVIVDQSEGVQEGVQYYLKESDTVLNKKILWVKDIQRSMSISYASMTSYFIERGWEEKYWTHYQDTLYPEIVLLPKLLVLYWDHYNTEEVLKAMSMGSTIIVVRGKLDENKEGCKDIDLDNLRMSDGTTKSFKELLADYNISSFSGKLYSYQTYMSTMQGGQITDDSDEDGGHKGQGAGIILSGQMFGSLQQNSLIRGVTFYTRSGRDLDGPIFGEMERATIRECRVVINGETINIVETEMSSPYSRSDKMRVASILVGVAKTSTIKDNTIRFRDVNSSSEDTRTTITFKQKNIEDGTNVRERNYGIVVGYFAQTGTFMPATLEGTVVKIEDDDNVRGKTLVINISDEGNADTIALHFGGQVGYIDKRDGSKLIANFVTYSMNIVINVEQGYTFNLAGDGELSLGAYVGTLKNADEVLLEKETAASETVRDPEITINYKSKRQSGDSLHTAAKNMFVGGMFGSIEGTQSLEIEGQTGAKVITNITNIFDGSSGEEYGTIDNKVAVGGFVGRIANNVSISNFEVHTLLQFKDWTSIRSMSSDQDTAFGGVVGFITGGHAVTLASLSDVKVGIEIAEVGGGIKKLVNVGGIVGKSLGSLNFGGKVRVSNKEKPDEGHYTIKVDVEEVNVGGAIGAMGNNGEIKGNATGNVLILADVETSAKNVVFGGIVGSASVRKINVKNMLYGGKFTHTLMLKSAESLTVGGLFGEIKNNAPEADAFVISDSLTYGDIFVDYSVVDDDAGVDDPKLIYYTFGGLIGNIDMDRYGENKISLNNVCSLLTNFNNRTTYVSGDISGMNVGALIGTTPKQKYTNAYYSSGVTLCYQEADYDMGEGAEGVEAYEYGTDLAYLNSNGTNYYGYSGVIGISNFGTGQNGILGKIPGLEYLRESYQLNDGMKLNPVVIDEFNVLYPDLDHWIADAEQSHDMTWVTLENDITIDGQISTQLDNVAFVGNGFTVTRVIPNAENVDYTEVEYAGGLFDEMFGHSIVSNMIIDANIAEDTSQTKYGVVVGNLNDECFIYGVGVIGTVSIGGENQVSFAGIAGTQYGGWISNCFVDADLTYRAEMGDSAYLIGVTCVEDDDKTYTTISDCYVSGSLIPYVSCNVVRIANSKKSLKTADIFDTYTIAHINTNQMFQTTTISEENDNVRGEYAFKNNCDNENSYDPLSYTDDPTVCGKDISAKFNNTLHYWHYDRAVNYGYATLPFGFMRVAEMKVFAILASASEVDEETGKTDNVYIKYLSDGRLLENLDRAIENGNAYFEIFNIKKFEQMLANTTAVRYTLRYDLDASLLSADAINKCITGKNFVLDGRNHNLKGYNKEFGIFHGHNGIIMNLRMTGVDMTCNNTNSADSYRYVVVLVNGTSSGDINNVHIEGTLENNTKHNAAGVVGKMTGGTISLVETIVNITTTLSMRSQEETVGGIAVEITKGTIQYSSNNGILTNNAYGNSVQNIVGGIVGKITGATRGEKIEIHDVYNNNAVLAGFTMENQANCYAGGIVGRISLNQAYDYIDDALIHHAYNIGFVGAGNYHIGYKQGVYDGLVYAGGIYGTCMAERYFKVANCINDGAVQAISYVDNSAEELEVRGIENAAKDIVLEDGTSIPKGKVGNTTELTNNPQTRVFEVKMTYNDGQARQVYADGIGNAVGGNNTTQGQNTTSTDNIKIDGNIGEESEGTHYIVFDRYAVLNNDDKFVTKAGQSVRNGIDGKKDVDGDYSFWAKFEDGEGEAYQVYGRDSYGFAKRIFKTDKITRQYGSGTNDILDAYDQFNIDDAKQRPSGWNPFRPREYQSYGRVYFNSSGDKKGVKASDTDFSQMVGDASKYFEQDGYNGYSLKGETVSYARSVTFSGYESFLDKLEEDAVALYNGDEAPKADVNDLIKEINAKFEENDDVNNHMHLYTVNGKQLVTVYNTNSYDAAVAPITGHVSFDFDIASSENSVVDKDSINVIYSGNYQFISNSNISVAQSGSNLRVTANATFKYSDEPGDVTASVSYARTIQDLLLTKNNVKTTGNTVRFSFATKAGGTLKKELAETVATAQANGDTAYNGQICTGAYRVKIGSRWYSTENYTMAIGVDGDDVPYVEITNPSLASNIKNYHGQSLRLEIGFKKYSTQQVTTIYGKTSNTGTYTFNLNLDKFAKYKPADSVAYYMYEGNENPSYVNHMTGRNSDLTYYTDNGTNYTLYFDRFLDVIKAFMIDQRKRATGKTDIDTTDFEINKLILQYKNTSGQWKDVLSYIGTPEPNTDDIAAKMVYDETFFTHVSGNTYTIDVYGGGEIFDRFRYITNVNSHENEDATHSGELSPGPVTETGGNGNFIITVDGNVGNAQYGRGASTPVGTGVYEINFYPWTYIYTREGKQTTITVQTTSAAENIGYTMTSKYGGMSQGTNKSGTKTIYTYSEAYPAEWHTDTTPHTISSAEQIKIEYVGTSRYQNPANVEIAALVADGLEFILAENDEYTDTCTVRSGFVDSSNVIYDWAHEWYSGQNYVETVYAHIAAVDMPIISGGVITGSEPGGVELRANYYIFENGGFAVKFNDEESCYVYNTNEKKIYQVGKVEYVETSTPTTSAGWDQELYMGYTVNGQQIYELLEAQEATDESPAMTKEEVYNQYRSAISNVKLYKRNVSSGPTTNQDISMLYVHTFEYRTGVTASSKHTYTMNIDLIFGNSKEDAIFVRNGRGTVTSEFNYSTLIAAEPQTTNMSIYCGDESYEVQTDTISSTVGSFVTTVTNANMAKGGDQVATKNGDQKFDAKIYNKDTKISILATHQVDLTGISVAKVPADEEITADYVLVTNNMYRNVPLGENKTILCLDDHIINTVISDCDDNGVVLLKQNSGNINNGILVGNASLRSLKDGSKTSLFMKGGTGSLTQIRLYGSYRNMSFDKNVEINTSAPTKLDGFVSSIVVSALDSNGDLSDKTAVLSKIIEKQSADSNNDILISGDAHCGADGANGNAENKNGQNGQNGGEGGKIENPENAKFARAGAGSVGGIGGNGFDARWRDNDSSDPTDWELMGRGDAGTGGTTYGTIAGHNARAVKQGASAFENVRDGINGFGAFGRIYASVGTEVEVGATTGNSGVWIAAADGDVNNSYDAWRKSNREGTGLYFGDENTSWNNFINKPYDDGVAARILSTYITYYAEYASLAFIPALLDFGLSKLILAILSNVIFPAKEHTQINTAGGKFNTGGQTWADKMAAAATEVGVPFTDAIVYCVKDVSIKTKEQVTVTADEIGGFMGKILRFGISYVENWAATGTYPQDYNKYIWVLYVGGPKNPINYISSSNVPTA